MASDIDTPPGMEPSTDGIPQWLVVHITQLKSLVKTNYKAIGEVKEDVTTIKAGQGELKTQLARTDQKIENHVQQHRDNPGSTNPGMKAANNPNSVTYKQVTSWLVKIGLVIGGGISAAIIKTIADSLNK